MIGVGNPLVQIGFAVALHTVHDEDDREVRSGVGGDVVADRDVEAGAFEDEVGSACGGCRVLGAKETGCSQHEDEEEKTHARSVAEGWGEEKRARLFCGRDATRGFWNPASSKRGEKTGEFVSAAFFVEAPRA